MEEEKIEEQKPNINNINNNNNNINQEQNISNNNQENNNNINNEIKEESEIFLDKTILNKYHIIKKIRRGSQAQVYLGENTKTFEQYAIKVEKNKPENCLLKNEIYMLSNLQSTSTQKNNGIVEMFSCANYKGYLILIEKLLGKSLDLLFLDLSKKFTLLDICQISLQCLDRIEFVHSKGIIHCDIKPENFVIGIEDPNVIYLIDFGLGQKYISLKTGKHIEFKFTGYMTGTARYASRNALRGKCLSRRDDIESFMYMILYFLAKKLPWQGLKAKNMGEKYKKIYNYKKDFNYKSFCKNYPIEITNLFDYVYSLAFNEKPSYQYMREMFKKILEQNNLFIKDFFSWMDKKEYEDINTEKRRAISETKDKYNENRKKIRTSITGNLKESTIAVTNLRLSRINSSKINLEESHNDNINEEDNNINNIDNDININNEKNTNLLSTGTNIKHKLDKYPDDEEEKKYELKKELEIIKEEENEDDYDIDMNSKKMGGSVHLYKIDNEFKHCFENKNNNINNINLTKSNINLGYENKEIKSKLIGKKSSDKIDSNKNSKNEINIENDINEEFKDNNNIKNVNNNVIKEEIKKENKNNIYNNDIIINNNIIKEELKKENKNNINSNDININNNVIKEKLKKVNINNNINIININNNIIKEEDIKEDKNTIKKISDSINEINKEEIKKISEGNNNVITLREIKSDNVMSEFDFKFDLIQKIKAGKNNVVPKKVVFKKKFKNDGNIKYSSVSSHDFYKKKGYYSATPRNVKNKVAKKLDEGNHHHNDSNNKNKNCDIF